MAASGAFDGEGRDADSETSRETEGGSRREPPRVGRHSSFHLSRYPGSPDAHFFVNYYSAETAHAKIPDDTWTHLAATYDEQTLTLYINGEKAASAIPQGSYGGPIQYGPSPLLIGKGSDGYGWFGKLDEVMLFNRVLSAQEINRLYQLTKDD